MKKMYAIVALMLVTLMHTYGQTCPTTIEQKSGTVLPVGKAVIKFTPTTTPVDLRIDKTSGQAQAQVNIYVNNDLKWQHQFSAGNYNSSNPMGKYLQSLTQVKNKEVRVEIINQSAGKQFGYSLKVEGREQSLMPNLSPETGNLIGNTKKTVNLKKSCTDKMKVIVKRTGGNAQATIHFYQNGNLKNKLSTTFNSNESQKVIILKPGVDGFNINHPVQVELKNNSVANSIKYSIDAVVN